MTTVPANGPHVPRPASASALLCSDDVRRSGSPLTDLPLPSTPSSPSQSATMPSSNGTPVYPSDSSSDCHRPSSANTVYHSSCRHSPRWAPLRPRSHNIHIADSHTHSHSNRSVSAYPLCSSSLASAPPPTGGDPTTNGSPSHSADNLLVHAVAVDQDRDVASAFPATIDAMLSSCASGRICLGLSIGKWSVLALWG